LIFSLEDAYFTRTETASQKITFLYLFLVVQNAAATLIKICRMGLVENIYPDLSQMKSKVWAIALPYALTVTAFFFQVIGWDHVTNQF
jgi:hypothetical protein